MKRSMLTAVIGLTMLLAGGSLVQAQNSAESNNSQEVSSKEQQLRINCALHQKRLNQQRTKLPRREGPCTPILSKHVERSKKPLSDGSVIATEPKRREE